jgi:predicted nuclease of predicted toxin-antitoxin system
MIRFLADESCDFSIVTALRDNRYDVLAVIDRMPGATDQQVIELALAEQRVLLTEDKDFGQLVFAAGKAGGGVIFIRYPANLRKELSERVLELVNREGDRLQHAFAVIQPGRVRISTPLK